MKKILFPFLISGCLLTTSCATKTIPSAQSISHRTSVDDAWKHLEAFQKIADQQQHNRSVGSPGGLASATYILDALKNMHLAPVVQEFTNSEGRKAQNILVEIKGKSSQVTMMGAHYDSVEFGPGINDNATGTAVLLEIIAAITAQKIVPHHTLRFAFWDSEEVKVEGSRYYVEQNKNVLKNTVANYINVDMVGTPSPTILVTDGDGSTWENLLQQYLENAKTDEEKNQMRELVAQLRQSFPEQVSGAKTLENIYSSYLAAKNIPYTADYLLSNSTDIFPFLGVVPAFGVVMTNETLSENGELSYAPCYHKACDTIQNVDRQSLQLALESLIHLLYEVAIK